MRLKTIRCPECKSTDLYKKGHKNDKQFYQCKKCGRYFVEGSAIKKRSLPTVVRACLKCGSKRVVRDGIFEDGAQRYKCKKCESEFRVSDYKKPPVEYKCPYCNGSLKRSGYGKLGQPVYMCTKCGKSCSGDPPKAQVIFRETNSVTCPYCNSTDINSKGMMSGYHRYVCKTCKKSFTDNTRSKLEKEEQQKEVCPRCGSTKTGSAGMGRGKHRYRCLSCNRTFTPNFTILEVNESDKKKILMYRFNLGLPVADIAKAFKYSEYKVRKVIKESGLEK